MRALVPLKSPRTAKTRLAPRLEDAERRELFFILAGHVLQTLREVGEIAEIMVITPSEDVARFATEEQVQFIRQSAETNMADACQTGADQALKEGVESVLILPGDLPLLSADDVRLLLRNAQSQRQIVIAPDRRREGTNALLCRPPNVIPFLFGTRSFDAHVAAARAAGAAAHVVEAPGLSFDIDDVTDFEMLRALIEGGQGQLQGDPPAALRDFMKQFAHRKASR